VVQPPLQRGERGATGAAADPFRRPHHEARATEIATKVELEPRQEPLLLARGIEGDAVGPSDWGTRQVAGTKADHPLFAGARVQIDVHHPRRASHRGLTAQFRGGGGSETKALAPGHGILSDPPTLAADP